MDSDVSRDLQKTIRAQEQKILGSFPFERRHAVLELIRSIDLFFLHERSLRDPSSDRGKETEMFFVYGCNKAIELFLDDSTENEMVPLNRSTDEIRTWANSVLYNCGLIATCEMLVDWERAQLGRFTVDDGVIRFNCTRRFVGLEAYEVEEFHWLQAFIAQHDQEFLHSLEERAPQIEDMMIPLVRRWRQDYIAYDTTPEIDSYYSQCGVLQCRLMFGNDSFPGEAVFEGLEFDVYKAAVGTLAGWMLKHIAFAKTLKRQHPDLEMANLLTVHQEKKVLAGYLAAALDVDIAVAQQCLRVMTLTHRDKPRLTLPKGPPAPLIELGCAHVLKSVAGYLNAPFDFLALSLREKYPGAYDRAVSLRERVFRDQLYALFPQPELICVPTSIKIREAGRTVTDIDAAIFDPRNEIAGLFQLKWQEPFGPSMRARESRRRNFLLATAAWTDHVHGFLQDMSPRKLADSFGLKLADAERIKQFRLFIVGRNFSHFSGDEEPDERAAWGMWPQILRLAAEAYDHANPVAGLYDGLKGTSPFLKLRPQINDMSFSLGQTRFVVTVG